MNGCRGASLLRHNRTFIGLPLDERLQSRNAQPRCGIQVIDLRTGDAVHGFRFEGVLSEIHDLIALPGVRCPMALGFKTDEIRRVLGVDSASSLDRMKSKPAAR
ncbi:hypothetical protein SIID45300_02453 [Candidatus Magnetaquicoccaceae bacterium FCR-1]|uniref:Conserved hypothetical protein CHP03032 domain-containing protein n=1 Tax=Candidatus Magnetaquiglobus chichijimensis TaxID=3141448 RepID=A0ABQ0CB45_9PROT